METNTTTNVETYKSLTITRTFVARTGQPWLQVKRGNARKLFANYTFRTVEQMEAYLAEIKRGEDSREENKTRRAAERKSVVNPYVVGDVVHHSWGYDQTNCDFYQVIAVTPKTVTLLEICSESVTEEGFMSDRRVARIDNFLENAKPFTCRVLNNDSTVKINHGYASKWDGRPKSCTWYA